MADIARINEIEGRLVKSQEKLAYLLAMEALVKSEHWKFLDNYIMQEMWDITEKEEVLEQEWRIHRAIGTREGLRRLLNFEKEINGIERQKENVAKLQLQLQEAMK